MSDNGHGGCYAYRMSTDCNDDSLYDIHDFERGDYVLGYASKSDAYASSYAGAHNREGGGALSLFCVDIYVSDEILQHVAVFCTDMSQHHACGYDCHVVVSLAELSRYDRVAHFDGHDHDVYLDHLPVLR